MFKLLIRSGFILLVLNVFVTSSEGLPNRGIWGYELNAAKALEELTNPTERGLGLSAWGIVAVTVGIMLAIVGMYYFSICYPVICQKSKKYDGMGQRLQV